MAAEPHHSWPVDQIDGASSGGPLDVGIYRASAGRSYAPCFEALPIAWGYKPPSRYESAPWGHLDGHAVGYAVYWVVYAPVVGCSRVVLGRRLVYVFVRGALAAEVGRVALSGVVLSFHLYRSQFWLSRALFRRLASLDLRRAALLRWITPLVAARSSSLSAVLTAAAALEFDGSFSMAERADATADLLRVRTDRLRAACLRCVRMLFALGIFFSLWVGSLLG